MSNWATEHMKKNDKSSWTSPRGRLLFKFDIGFTISKRIFFKNRFFEFFGDLRRNRTVLDRYSDGKSVAETYRNRNNIAKTSSIKAAPVFFDCGRKIWVQCCNNLWQCQCWYATRQRSRFWTLNCRRPGRRNQLINSDFASRYVKHCLCIRS